MKIRLIKEKDNLEVEKLIRDCLIEFGGNKPGCAWEDKDLGPVSYTHLTLPTIYSV